jgi:hypothetical protein
MGERCSLAYPAPRIVFTLYGSHRVRDEGSIMAIAPITGASSDIGLATAVTPGARRSHRHRHHTQPRRGRRGEKG